jgi:glycerol uptake facilitator-like aquaporin
MRIFHYVWRSVRQLFHEATGALFLVFSGVGAFSAVRQWSNPAGHWIAWLAAGYALMMGAFGVNAFRDSRRVR